MDESSSATTATNDEQWKTPTQSLRPRFVLDVILQEETYCLPLKGTVELLQRDGSTVSLGPEFIVVNGQKVVVPSETGKETIIRQFGTEIIFKPTQIHPPRSLMNAVSGLQDLTVNAAVLVERTSGQLGRLATGEAENLFERLGNSIVSASDILRRLVHAINDVELGILCDPDLLDSNTRQLLFDTLNLARKSYDILTSSRGLVQDFQSLKSDVALDLKINWKAFTAPTGLLTRTTKALDELTAHDWKKSVKKDETPDFYMITTVTGTSLDTFEQFIQELDGGKGTKQASQNLYHQNYWTWLSPAAAKTARDKEYVQWVFKQPSPETLIRRPDESNERAAPEWSQPTSPGKENSETLTQEPNVGA
jgi:hypothetical protein